MEADASVRPARDWAWRYRVSASTRRDVASTTCLFSSASFWAVIVSALVEKSVTIPCSCL